MPVPGRDFRQINRRRKTDRTEEQVLQSDTCNVSAGNGDGTRCRPEPAPQPNGQTGRQNAETMDTTGGTADFAEQHNNIYIDFIWDVTYSGHVICPAVYPEILAVLRKIEEKSRENPGKNFYIGLTLFHGERGENGLKNGQYFGSVDDMRESLKDVEFYGGSSDGYEDLYAALDFSMDKLRDETEPNANRNVILISDSTVREGTQQRSYNVGLRTALVYVNMQPRNFWPGFKTVDREGNEGGIPRAGAAPETGPIPVKTLWDPQSRHNLKTRSVDIYDNSSAFNTES